MVVCYDDRVGWHFSKNVLRGDGYRVEGGVELEGTVKYNHQGGRQNHATHEIIYRQTKF